MIDDRAIRFPSKNIGTLLREISTIIDLQLQELRAGSRYEKVRHSDVKVFMCAFRSSATVSEIARELDVTRQAVHASVQRLVELKVLDLQSQPNNGRDKLVVVTDRGRHAQQTALDHIKIIEAQMAEIIGKKELEILRGQLYALATSLKRPA
jgi:DNA-binding MarR family transcriptional regulator